MRSGARSAWSAAKRAAARLAAAAAIVVLTVAVTGHGEGAASEPGGSEADVYQPHLIEVIPAVLPAERAREQAMLCHYEVHATFGVSIFTDRQMSAKLLARMDNGDELSGSCFTYDGGDTIGCSGLSWEHEWIRVRSGTTLGWSPVSCFKRLGEL